MRVRKERRRLVQLLQLPQLLLLQQLLLMLLEVPVRVAAGSDAVDRGGGGGNVGDRGVAATSAPDPA